MVHGKQEGLVPPGLTFKASNKWGEYEKANEYMDNLYGLMDGKLCNFSEEAQLEL